MSGSSTSSASTATARIACSTRRCADDQRGCKDKYLELGQVAEERVRRPVSLPGHQRVHQHPRLRRLVPGPEHPGAGLAHLSIRAGSAPAPLVPRATAIDCDVARRPGSSSTGGWSSCSPARPRADPGRNPGRVRRRAARFLIRPGPATRNRSPTSHSRSSTPSIGSGSGTSSSSRTRSRSSTRGSTPSKPA